MAVDETHLSVAIHLIPELTRLVRKYVPGLRFEYESTTELERKDIEKDIEKNLTLDYICSILIGPIGLNNGMFVCCTTNQINNIIMIFTNTGKLVNQWTHNKLYHVIEIAVMPFSQLLAVLTLENLVIFTLDGKLLQILKDKTKIILNIIVIPTSLNQLILCKEKGIDRWSLDHGIIESLDIFVHREKKTDNTLAFACNSTQLFILDANALTLAIYDHVHKFKLIQVYSITQPQPKNCYPSWYDRLFWWNHELIYIHNAKQTITVFNEQGEIRRSFSIVPQSPNSYPYPRKHNGSCFFPGDHDFQFIDGKLYMTDLYHIHKFK